MFEVVSTQFPLTSVERPVWKRWLSGARRAAVVSRSRAAGGREFVLFACSLQWTAWSPQQDLCLWRSKDTCGRGPEASTSFFWILSSPRHISESLIRRKLKWRKPSVSVLHSLLLPLCACLSPPLRVLRRPSELCVHFGPPGNCLSGILTFTFFKRLNGTCPSPLASPRSTCLTCNPFFQRAPSSQVVEFYKLEPRAKLSDGAGTRFGVRKSDVWINIRYCNSTLSFMIFCDSCK